MKFIKYSLLSLIFLLSGSISAMLLKSEVFNLVIHNQSAKPVHCWYPYFAKNDNLTYGPAILKPGEKRAIEKVAIPKFNNHISVYTALFPIYFTLNWDSRNMLTASEQGSYREKHDYNKGEVAISPNATVQLIIKSDNSVSLQK